MEKKVNETTISQLPDEILHHILSFLPFELAVRTSSVSKRWKRIWVTSPYINLDITPVIEEPELFKIVSDDLLMRQRNNICIRRFKIEARPCVSHLLASYMKIWVESLFQNCNIRELFLVNYCHNPSKYYSVPHAIFSLESLTKLTLAGCLLKLEVSVDIKLVSLKVLSLNYLSISHELVEQLVSSCVALEFLSLNSCDGFSSLKVVGLPVLKVLGINKNRDLKRVEINEPSLIDLFYDGGHKKHYNDIKFANCVNLKNLYLANANITDEGLNEQLLSLEKLEDLAIVICPEITSLNILGHCLKKLLLNHSEELTKAKIIAPNLQSFTLVRNCVAKICKKSSFSLFAPPTLVVKYKFLPKVLGPNTFIELLKFLSMFSSPRLTFDTNIPMTSSIPQEWTKYFSRMKSLSQFKRFWADPSARFFDVFRSTCHEVRRVCDYQVQILTDEPIEVDDDEELQSLS